MLSEVRLEKNWGASVDGRVIYYKYLIFGEIWKIHRVVQIFPVLYLNSLCRGHPEIHYNLG